MNELPWDSTIMVCDVAVLVEPVAGTLVSNGTSWLVLQDGLLLAGLRNGSVHDVDPILPAVPPRLTCFQIASAVYPTKSPQTVRIGLDRATVVWRPGSNMPSSLPYLSHSDYTTADALKAHECDMQKYGAVLAWIKLHEEAGND